MRNTYLEKNGPTGIDKFFSSINVVSKGDDGANTIYMYRSPLPGQDMSHERMSVPMLIVETLPPGLMGSNYDPDKASNYHSTRIWFNNHEGWKAASRLARRIANGKKINAILVSDTSPVLKVVCAEEHWDNDPIQTSAKEWISSIFPDAPQLIKEFLFGSPVKTEIAALTIRLMTAFKHAGERAMWQEWALAHVAPTARRIYRRKRMQELHANGLSIAEIARTLAATEYNVKRSLASVSAVA